MIDVKQNVRTTQALLQATLNEVASSESHLQQSRQELKTEEERLEKLKKKVRLHLLQRVAWDENPNNNEAVGLRGKLPRTDFRASDAKTASSSPPCLAPFLYHWSSKYEERRTQRRIPSLDHPLLAM